MGRFSITFQKKLSLEAEFWAFYDGTTAKAIELAKDLLEALRESGFNKARVWLNDKRIRVKV